MRKFTGTFLFICLYIGAFSQTTALRLPAQRTSLPVKIDGNLSDSAWSQAAIMTNLVEFRPTEGVRENDGNKTITYLMYNDEGIFFGGYCYERTKDSIAAELTGRDGFGTNDYVGIIFDTYLDHLNGFEYFVTPLNEQWDAKMSPNTNGNSEDFSWNAVWESAAVIHNDGWSFEMFIPYSAIRFGKKEVQDWGLNITRRRRKTEQQYAWNPINRNISGFLTQEGIWTGVSNIKPPLRLQFSPYFSTYVNHYPSNIPGKSNWSSSVNGGMDVKYGISQAITLDMTLVPDFGQVQSDDQILNTTPFEVKFNEYRSFFTEGTELFSKGDLFYSRRIGGKPMLYDDLKNNSAKYISPTERIISNPQETKLINATKISGRLQNGLGIGFLNAITSAQHATIEDEAKNQREIETSPLTNYNIIVLNQSMKNNSSVSFINTNVWRSGNAYDGNVMAGLFDFNDKKNTWNVGGKLANSLLTNINSDGHTESGFSHKIYFGKISGRFNFQINQEMADAKFNSNDLNYFTFNNFLNHSAWLGYRWLKPSNWYNNIYLNLNAFYARRVKPAAYRNANIYFNVNGQLKNLWYAGINAGYEPKNNDFNEPRVDGRVFKGWASRFVGAWVETNQSKKYSVYTELFYISRTLFNSKRYVMEFGQRFRFNDKLSLRYELEMEPQTNNVGFANYDGTVITFGRRNRNTIENTFVVKYNFNSKMGLNARVRHYWSKLDYKEYYTLLQDGNLESNPAYTGDHNQNVNIFNVDMTYTWQFAPGSFLNIVWKNAASDVKDRVEKNYFKNVEYTMDADQNNNISLKVIYFLDYLTFRKWMKG